MTLIDRIRAIDLKDRKTLIIFISSIALLIAVVAGIVITVTVSNQRAIDNTTKSIFISSAPKKLHYFVGEEADYTGLAVRELKNSGRSVETVYSEETAEAFTVTGFDTSKPYDERKITVEYGGFSCHFFITVEKIPKPAPVLEAIDFEKMPKTLYKVGEKLNVIDGMLRLYYSDGTTKRDILINRYVSGWKEACSNPEVPYLLDIPGTYTLTVRYAEDGIVKSVDYEITVTE